MSEGVGDPRLAAEGELSLARLALDDNEVGHAADHVATALATSPSLPDAHAVLVTLLTHPEGGVDLWTLDGDVYVGTAVARAHALAFRGEYAEALSLLVSVQGHEPGMAWADVPWVLDSELAAKLDPDELLNVLVQLLKAVPDPCPEELAPAFAPYVQLVRNLVAEHPASGNLLWLASVLTRRLGLLDEATSYAIESERVEPTDRAAIAVGYALRSQGRTDEALAAFERALSYQPRNVAVYADIAGMLGDAGRLDEGISWAERSLALDPVHDCSLVERHSLLFRRDGAVDDLVAIADLLRSAEPGSHEKQHAAGELNDRSRQVWLGGIPDPTEAVINVLDQLLAAENVSAGGATLTVSALEPPSALLAFGLAVPGSEVTVSEILPPDPRLPVSLRGSQSRPVETVVWQYDGSVARPAVAPPSAEGVAAVARVADFGESSGVRARSVWASVPAAYGPCGAVGEHSVGRPAGRLGASAGVADRSGGGLAGVDPDRADVGLSGDRSSPDRPAVGGIGAAAGAG
ncbi:tetratricopeptide repeat protein [Kribbella pittospori]|uniref:tetratricopeptide repeat protein n=1 Tax=Kribbella pittospori TaxID=722689 RepID=UPI00192D6689|nr:tetratricopeptide repeat protein [Kribbella pittospori]